MPRHTALAPLAVLALIGGAAACGDDDASTSPTTTDPSMTSEPSTPGTPSSEPSEPSEPSDTSPPTSPDISPAPPSTKPRYTVEPIPPASTPPTSTPPGSLPRPDDPQVDTAFADLAERLGVDESAISVSVYQAVEWRDGSIGCPKPGMFYTQATVPGRRLVLTLDGKDYAYHADRTSEFFYCAKPAPDPTVPGGT